MRIIGVDPGPTEHGWVVLDVPTLRVYRSGTDPVGDVERMIAGMQAPLAIEWITSYGGAVGASVFDMARNVGRLQAVARKCAPITLLTNPEVKHIITGRRNAKSAVPELRAMFARRHGCEASAAGVKGKAKAPGPCFGVAGHAWDALAVAVAFGIHHQYLELS